MEGQAVTIGSSISATGNMLVSCNRPYVLKVDDVVWSPVEVLDGADRFILSSGGLVEIMVDGERIFFFRNSITPAFAFTTNELKLKAGGAQGESRGDYYAPHGTYNQQRFSADDIDYAQVAVYPVGGSAVVDGLELVVNQGNAVVGTTSEDFKQFRITGLDPKQYLSVSLGNVLLAFVLPFEG